tara:strand:+ start:8201 stop:8926 length:726 start_codon:yes stop_codon:yes gene_type:complete
MNVEITLIILFTLIIAIFCAYWYKENYINPDKIKSFRINKDPYLQEVSLFKSKIDKAVTTTIRQHEQELEQRYKSDAGHLQRKERLSQFAKDTELDKALIIIWEEIEHYPLWLKRDDSDKWNKLNLQGINSSNKEDSYTVEFIYNSQKFKIVEKTQSETGGLNSILFLFENDIEVFTIECEITAIDDETNHISQQVCAFKERGNWPKVLLELYGQIKIEQGKSADEVKYFRANEFKSRFES